MMFQNKQFFLASKWILAMLAVSLFLNIFLWIFFIAKVNTGESLVPLHYNIYFGIDLLGPWYRIFLIPTFGLFIVASNTVVAYFLIDKDKFLSHSVMMATLLCQALLLIPGIYLANLISV